MNLCRCSGDAVIIVGVAAIRVPTFPVSLRATRDGSRWVIRYVPTPRLALGGTFALSEP